MIRRLANSAWATVEYLIVPILTIVSAPLILRVAGTDGYATVVLFSTLGAIGNGLSVATGVAVLRRATLQGESSGLLAGCTRVAVLSGVVLGVGVLAFFALGGAALFGRLGSAGLLIHVAASALVVIVLDQLDAVLAAFFRAREQFSLLSGVEMGARAMQFAGALIALHASASVLAYLAAFCVGAALRVGVKVAVLRKRGAPPVVSPAVPSEHTFSSAASLFAEARWGWAQGFAGTFFNIADRLVIGSAFGAAALSHYALASQMAIQVHALTSAGCSAAMPRLMRALSADAPRSRDRYLSLMLGSVVGCSVLALALGVFGRTIAEHWVGAAMAAEVYPLLVVLAIAYWVLGLNIGPHFLLMSNGNFRLVSTANVAAGCIFAALLLWIASSARLVEVAWTRVSFGLVLIVIYYPVVRRLWLRES